MARTIAPTFRTKEEQEYLKKGLWSGKLLPAYGESLARSAPDAACVVDRGRTYTFAQIDAWAGRVAEFLQGLGVRKGEAITFQLPNWAESIVLNQAALKIGAVINPVIPIYRERELSFILKQAESAVYVVPASFRNFDYTGMAQGLQRETPSLKHIVAVGESRAKGVHAFPAAPPDSAGAGMSAATGAGKRGAALQADDPALLLYTSGTTASPKGVVHTHNTLIAENESMAAWYRWSGSDVIFMGSPVTHITGYLYGMLLPFMLGTKVVLLDVWYPAQAIALMRRHGCTLTVGATPFLQDLLDTIRKQGLKRDDLPLRTFACGGADVPAQLIYDVRSYGIGAGRVYGSSEYPTYSCPLPDSPLELCAASDGLPMSGEGKVVDDDGNAVAQGKAGELLLKGPERFLGYLDAALNADSFTSDGWFRTGDLVAFRADGSIEVKGRKKDIINRGGEKISAKEVEDLLYKHPLVKEVAIVAMPDERLTEKACAYVVPKDAAHAPTLQDFAAYLAAERVAKQKYPERVEIIAALPKTASGKVEKYVLRNDIRRKLGKSSEERRT